MIVPRANNVRPYGVEWFVKLCRGGIVGNIFCVAEKHNTNWKNMDKKYKQYLKLCKKSRMVNHTGSLLFIIIFSSSCLPAGNRGYSYALCRCGP